MIQLMFLAFVAGLLVSLVSRKIEMLKKWINGYLIWFGLPFFIFTSLINTEIQIGKFLIFSLAFLIVINFIVYFCILPLKLTPQKSASIFLGSLYGNTGYLGVPIAYLIFGSDGAVLAAIFTLMLSIIHFSLGIYLSNKYVKKGRPAFIDTLKSPLLWGMILALILSRYLNSLPLPFFALSGTVVYIAPFLIGLSLRLGKIDKSYFYALVLKFIFVPLLFFVFLLMVNLSDFQERLLLFLSFLPPAFASTSIAIKYNYDDAFLANFTSISTIIFLVFILMAKMAGMF